MALMTNPVTGKTFNTSGDTSAYTALGWKPAATGVSASPASVASVPKVAPTPAGVSASNSDFWGVNPNVAGNTAALASGIYQEGATNINPDIYKPITPDILKNEDAIKFPNIPDNLNLADGMVAGAKVGMKSYEDYIKALTPPETALDKQQQSVLDMMTSLTGDLGNKGADQLAQEQAAGIPALKARFADINGQIATKTAEYNVLQVANQNKPITMNSIIGNERAILNAKAADIGLLQAQALAAQGQMEAAQEMVNRSIDLKYSTIEARLNTYQAQLNAIQPMLNKQEKIQAEARQLMIDNQKQVLADQKQVEKDKLNTEISLLGNGYKYVSTPVERDRLKAQGYDIAQVGGRTYAKPKELTPLELYEGQKKIDQKYKTPDKTNFEIKTVNGEDVLFNPATGETKSMTANIASGDIVTNNIGGRDVKLDSVALPSLNIINQQALDFGGLKIGATATSTLRTTAQQQALYDAYLKGGPQAAKPGTSAHEKGLAIDLYPDQVYIEKMKPIMEANGWAQNAGENDKGHFEYVGKQDGKVSKYQGIIDLVSTAQLTPKEALEKVPDKDRIALSNELAKIKSPSDTESDTEAKEKMITALNLKTDPGLNSAVGPTFLTRGNKLNKWDQLTGNTQNFIGNVEQLVSGLSLDALIEAKAKGATFGALSDKEMLILSQSATKIGNWARKDTSGKTTGYAIDQKNFKEELDNIAKIFNRAIKSEMLRDDNTLDPMGILSFDNANSTNPLGF